MDVAIGVRCWKDRIAFVALSDGEGDQPAVALHRRIKIPAGNSDGERVVWVHKAAVEAIQEARATTVAVRVSDTAGVDQTRAEHEGVVLLTAALNNLPAIVLRRQSMLKPLGIERAKGAWAEFQRTDPFLLNFVADERDAAMAARALLSRGTTR